MRKFKLQVQITVDGDMAGPTGEMAWTTFPWTDDIDGYIDITDGGSTLVSDLIAKGLLDELHLFVNPVAIGAGMPVFPNLGAHQRLRLVTAQPFDCGITALHAEPRRS